MKSVLQDVSSEFIKKRATVTFLFGGKNNTLKNTG